MELHQAVKEIITKYGIVIIATKQFANVLDDMGAFKTTPAATKNVLKGLLDCGFGEILFQAAEKKEPNWQNSARKIVTDYSAKSGYKDELVNGLAGHLLLGVGLIDELPKSNTSQSQQYSAQQKKHKIRDPKELLFALKDDYIKALNDLVSVTNDEFGNLYSFFSTDANTQLYVLDAKIRLVAKEVEDTDIDSWLTKERRKVECKNRPSASQIKQSLEDILRELERDFNTLMEKSVEINDDDFGLKSASFNSESATEFADIEKKIIHIGKRLNEDKTGWIDKTKSDFLAFKNSPISARNGVLDQLQNEYSARLVTLDKETKSGEIDLSDSELKETRRKLINLGSLLHKDMEKWCDFENEKLANERYERAEKKKKRNIFISSAAGLVLLIGGWQGISYTSSADARAAYETTMELANTAYSSGNYLEALTLYEQAENGYDASYSSSSYKGEAHAKAIETTDKIISDWEVQVRPLLQSNKPAQAKSLTLALPPNLVLEGTIGERYNSLSQQIDTDLSTRTSAIVDELLNDLYTHNGHLSESGKQELEDMIAVVRDNYWLNFIMEKTK